MPAQCPTPSLSFLFFLSSWAFPCSFHNIIFSGSSVALLQENQICFLQFSASHITKLVQERKQRLSSEARRQKKDHEHKYFLMLIHKRLRTMLHQNINCTNPFPSGSHQLFRVKMLILPICKFQCSIKIKCELQKYKALKSLTNKTLKFEYLY